VIEKVPVSMDFFIEDWNESQFWVCFATYSCFCHTFFCVCSIANFLAKYADETAMLYAYQLLEGATADMTIALVSAPSVFVALKKVVVSFSLSGFHSLVS